MTITSKQRFVKEYANYKIAILEDLAKPFPEKRDLCSANVTVINKVVRDWERGCIMTDEAMRIIAEL